MPKSSRRKARILAFQTIYQRQKLEIQESGEMYLSRQATVNKNHQEFAQNLIAKTWEELTVIDQRIQANLQGWRQDRISGTLNALLRIGACELLFFPETEGKVVINEAIEICRSYVDQEATAFLNGILHAVWNGSSPQPT